MWSGPSPMPEQRAAPLRPVQPEALRHRRRPLDVAVVTQDLEPDGRVELERPLEVRRVHREVEQRLDVPVIAHCFLRGPWSGPCPLTGWGRIGCERYAALDLVEATGISAAGPGHLDLAAAHDVEPVGDRQDVLQPLLDDQHRRPAVGSGAQQPEHPPHDHRREPERHLVGDDDVRSAGEDPREDQDLLLATGQQSGARDAAGAARARSRAPPRPVAGPRRRLSATDSLRKIARCSGTNPRPALRPRVERRPRRAAADLDRPAQSSASHRRARAASSTCRHRSGRRARRPRRRAPRGRAPRTTGTLPYPHVSERAASCTSVLGGRDERRSCADRIRGRAPGSRRVARGTPRSRRGRRARPRPDRRRCNDRTPSRRARR